MPPPTPPTTDSPSCTHRSTSHCRFTSPFCCACADSRPHEPTYTHSGISSVFRTAKRWSNYCVSCVDFWEYQVRRARITPEESRIPEYPVPIGSVWPGLDAHGIATGLTSRSAKRRVARRVRRRGVFSARSLDADEEEGWVEREEERERREKEEERERLAGLVQLAKERYERAVEKLSTFAGESVDGEEAEEEEEEDDGEEGGGAMAASPRPAAVVETTDERSFGRDRSPGGARSESPGVRAVVYPPDSISDDDSQFGRFHSFSPADSTEHFHSPPPAIGTPNRFRTFNPFAHVDPHDYTTPSPPSVISADDCEPWYPATSFPSLPPHRTPLLSPESRHLAEEISVVLELLSRTAEIDMDDDAQKKSIEQAFENTGKLRSQYCGPLPEESPVAPPLEEFDGKCVICYGGIANVVLVPCHHLIMCETCYAQFENTRYDYMGYDAMNFGRLSCPVCRSEVIGKIKVFRG